MRVIRRGAEGDGARGWGARARARTAAAAIGACKPLSADDGSVGVFARRETTGRVGVRSRRRGRRAWCGDDAVATMRGGARRARGKG